MPKPQLKIQIDEYKTNALFSFYIPFFYFIYTSFSILYTLVFLSILFFVLFLHSRLYVFIIFVVKCGIHENTEYMKMIFLYIYIQPEE